MAHKVLKWSLHFFLSTCQARSWQSVGTVSGILPTRLCPHTVIQGRRSCGAFISNSLKQLKQTQNVASVIEEQSLKISLNFNSFKKPTFSNYPFCIHMCVCVYEHMYVCFLCVCMQVCVCEYLHVCPWRPAVDAGCIRPPFILCFETVFLTKLGVHWLPRLGT